MVFAEIESQLRTEGGWNMHIAIALIMALLVTAGVLWFFFAPRKAYRAPLRDGVQEAVVEVKGGYSPAVIEAEAGVPLRLIFDRKEDGECSSHVVFSDFGVDLALPAFRTTTLTLHPDQPGEYPFACGMNMLHGTLRILPGKHASVGAAAGSAVGSVGAATRGNANESVYCATKWGEKGYTTSLKAAYKGTSVKVVGVYPGGIDTDFYHDSHDYVSLDKQHSFMSAAELAEVVLFNLVNDANLTVSDILIERNYR